MKYGVNLEIPPKKKIRPRVFIDHLTASGNRKYDFRNAVRRVSRLVR